jgi:hypothetical protein
MEGILFNEGMSFSEKDGIKFRLTSSWAIWAKSVKLQVLISTSTYLKVLTFNINN